MTEREVRAAQAQAAELLQKAGITVTQAEREHMEICDYQLNQFEKIGTSIIIYVNTDRCCAKELILLPRQLCPEHLHPALGEYPGKEETFRCRWGEVYLYVPGEAAASPKAVIPEGKEDTFHVFHEIVLKPGDQYTLKEQTPHWFQAGSAGAVVSEFSTKSFDRQDIFFDPQIRRVSNLDG